MDIQSMSLEEKIGQLFIVQFNGNKVTGDIINLITMYNIGGAYYQNNQFKNPRQVHTLSTNLQRFAHKKLPLFIMATQQGGNNNTITKGITNSPSQQKISEVNNRLYTKQMAEIVAKELQAMGINLNVAPNLQLKDQEDSFGHELQSTSRHGLATVQGNHHAHVIAAPNLDDYLEVFQENLFSSTTLQPPVQNLRNELKVLFFSHEAFKQFHQKIPNFKIEETVTSDRVIITDCSRHMDVDELVSNVESGADMFVIDGSFTEQYEIINRMIECVKEGLISKERINDSFQKIVALKQKKNIGELTTFNRNNFLRKRSVALAKKMISLST